MNKEQAEQEAERRSGYDPAFSAELTRTSREGCNCSACYWRRVHVLRLMNPLPWTRSHE